MTASLRLEPPTTDPAAAAIEEINRKYALVRIGDRPFILCVGTDRGLDHGLVLMTVAGFHDWLRPHMVWVGDRHVQASKLWMASNRRRQYEGIVFDPCRDAPPDCYNLWRGFAVERRTGSCQRFLDHVADNVCNGDKALFSWVIGWFAALVQYPWDKVGTSIVLRGAQGTGKTIVGQTVGRLLGEHYAPASSARYVTGRFNSHLAKCLLLQLDEATWGGDHAAAGALKDLITGEWQFIECKGKEPVRVRNYVRLLITSNRAWVVPAGLEERRFCMLDVADHRRQDHQYFRAILDELDAGGYEALLDYLLSFDLSDVPLHNVPRTPALLEQAVHSLSPDHQWWLDVLGSGVLPGDTDGTGQTECAVLHKAYVATTQLLGVTR